MMEEASHSRIWEWILEKLASNNATTLSVLSALITKVGNISSDNLQQKIAVRYLEQFLSENKIVESVIPLINSLVNSPNYSDINGKELLLRVYTEVCLGHLRNGNKLENWEGFEQSLELLFPADDLSSEYLGRRNELKKVLKEKRCQSIFRKYPLEDLKYDLKKFVEEKKKNLNENFLDKLANDIINKEKPHSDHTLSPTSKCPENDDELNCKGNDGHQNEAVVANASDFEAVPADDAGNEESNDDCSVSEDFPEVNVLLQAEAENLCLKCKGQKKLSKCQGCSSFMCKRCFKLCSQMGTVDCPVCAYKTAVSAYKNAKREAVQAKKDLLEFSKKNLLEFKKNDKSSECPRSTHEDSEKSEEDISNENVNNDDNPEDCGMGLGKNGTTKRKRRMRFDASTKDKTPDCPSRGTHDDSEKSKENVSDENVNNGGNPEDCGMGLGKNGATKRKRRVRFDASTKKDKSSDCPSSSTHEDSEKSEEDVSNKNVNNGGNPEHCGMGLGKNGTIKRKRRMQYDASTKNDKSPDCTNSSTHEDSEKSEEDISDENVNNSSNPEDCGMGFDKKGTMGRERRMRGSICPSSAKKNPLVIDDQLQNKNASRLSVIHNISKARIPWTKEEVNILLKGLELFPAVNGIRPWKRILEYGKHVFNSKRQPMHLKDKWRNIQKTGS